MSAAPSRLTRVAAGAPPATFGTCAARGTWWLIEAEPHVLIRLKRVFGRVDKAERDQVRIRRSAEVDRDLQWFLDRYPLEMSDDDARELHRGAERHREEARIVARVLAGDYAPRDFDLAIPLRDYQRTAADLVLRTNALLLADDLGVGKTASAIGMLSDPATRPALVVTMTHLADQWRRELGRFLPGARVHVLDGTKPYDIVDRAARQDRRAGILRPAAFPDVLVTTYHRIHGWAGALSPRVRSVVYDEVQELRHGKTDRYAAASLLSGATRYRLGLSATPIHNYGGEFYNVIEAIRPGALGTRDEFVREWCTAAEEERKTRVKDPRAFGLYLRESGIMLRRTRKDVGRELPPLTVIPHHVDADMGAIDKIAGNAGELARTILAQTTGAGAGLAKLQASGEFDRIIRQATGIAKAPYVAAFVRLLVESGEPVLLFGWHRSFYDLIGAALKDLEPAFYTGTESPKQKADAIERFRTGKTRVLVMSLRSGAGVDGLQHACRTVVVGELDWSPVVHDQGIGRVDRDGQPDPVTAYFLISDVGSDPIVSDVCGAKRAQSSPIRDPHAAMMQRAAVDPQHVKRLAESFLARQR